MTRNKYNALPVDLDGYHFDSTAEANRYRELLLLEKAGEIVYLEIHPWYRLQKSFRKNGKLYRAIYYEADFMYEDVATGGIVVEDVKGVETAVFKLKMKLFLFQYPGLDFRIVKA